VNKVRVSVADKELTGHRDTMPETFRGVVEMFQGWLEAIPAEHRDSAQYFFAADGDDPPVSVSVIYMRPETDGERLEREQTAKIDAANSRLRDLRTLAEVKQRLGLE